MLSIFLLPVGDSSSSVCIIRLHFCPKIRLEVKNLQQHYVLALNQAQCSLLEGSHESPVGTALSHQEIWMENHEMGAHSLRIDPHDLVIVRNCMQKSQNLLTFLHAEKK